MAVMPLVPCGSPKKQRSLDKGNGLSLGPGLLLSTSLFQNFKMRNPLPARLTSSPPLPQGTTRGREDYPRALSLNCAFKTGYHSAAAGVASASSTGGARSSASFSSAIRASFSRAS